MFVLTAAHKSKFKLLGFNKEDTAGGPKKNGLILNSNSPAALWMFGDDRWTLSGLEKKKKIGGWGSS